MVIKPLIEIKNMSKSFGITKALDDVSLMIPEGSVCGLVGENGSGKSTLASILAGMQDMDKGTIFFQGEEYQPNNILDASQKGISMIIQEKGTINGLSVASNIFLGKEKMFSSKGFIDMKKMNQAAQVALENIGENNIKSEQYVDELNFEDSKIVEIARAMSNTPKLLIVDETTTAIAHKGRELLYSLIKKTKKENNSVLFITHDLEELQEVSDYIIVLRDGKYIGNRLNQNLNVDELKEMMVGREVADNFYRSDYPEEVTENKALSVKGLTLNEQIRNISFDAYKGEILGIGGLSECGMHELGKAMFGLLKPIMGSIEVTEKRTTVKNPEQAKKISIAYLSKNRDSESILLNTSIKDNIVLPSISDLSQKGYISKKKEREFSEEWANVLEVKRQDINQYVAELSGGNKQKVAIAKWLGKGSDILIFDCPTRGIDIGVKVAIYRLMEDLRNQGKCIIMISEEMPELIGMSDRIIIMKDGKISGVLNRSPELTENEVVRYMI
jgi:ribose transport system ATP-binding protein